MSVLTEANGVPLSLVVTGANRHDSAVLEALLDDRFVPGLPDETIQPNLCLDAGYVANKKSLLRTITSRIFAHVVKKKWNYRPILNFELAAGALSLVIHGSNVFASFVCDMKKCCDLSMACFHWPLV